MNIKMDALRHNRYLREFILEDVRPTDIVLGTGSYGTVEEVTINNTYYAAKKIHEVLLETEERGWVERIVGRYIEECRLMSRIHHPNIIQFMGVCFLDGSRLPLLVMERLNSSLDNLIESCPNIPLLLKVTILTDIANGLYFLHQQNPSIIHQDLTAKNVLLTASFTAKITDFSNSRIVQLQPDEIVSDTCVYMPPEALSTSRTPYSPQLDVFSFGVLVLFTINQVFPGDLLSPTHQDPSNPKHTLGRSEVERRVMYTDLLKTNLLRGRQHPLFVLVRECLSNTPERRPPTSRLLSTLEEMTAEMDVGFLQLDLGRLKAREVAGKNVAMSQRDTLLQEKDTQLEGYRNEIAAKDNIISQKNIQLADQEAQIQKHREEIGYKDVELARRAALVQRLEGLVHSRPHGSEAIERDRRGASLARLDQPPPPPAKLKPPLTLKQRRGKDVPFEMSFTVQSVVIGNSVFVGGGSSSTISQFYAVMVYDFQVDQWSSLQYKARCFAMTSLNNQLVLVGGYVSGRDKATNQVSVLQSGKWVCPYAVLNIPRSWSTAVSFNNHIIVAGGIDSDGHDISSVEVLDITSNRWCIADPLPCVLNCRKSVVVEDMCYLMGGVDQTCKYTNLVHSVDLEELTKKAVSMATNKTGSRHSTLWRTEEDSPLKRCSPLALKGSLLAVGGFHDRGDDNFIYLYQPGTRRWMKVGDLPNASFICTCSVLPNEEVFVAGGFDRKSLNTVSFLSVTECS